MSDFLPAFWRTMSFEDPQHLYALIPDNQGNVISGINSLAWPAQFAAIAAIPQAQRGPAIQQFYLQCFWEPMNLAGLKYQDLANQVFDSGVNQGSGTAGALLQRACNSVAGNSGTLEVDGDIGPLTLAEANSLLPLHLLDRFIQVRIDFYRQIVKHNPADEPYLADWIRRTLAP